MSQAFISPPAPSPGAMAPAAAPPAPKDTGADGAFHKALGAATSQQSPAKDASKTSSSRATKTGKGNSGRSKDAESKAVKGQDPAAASLLTAPMIPTAAPPQLPLPAVNGPSGASGLLPSTGPVQASVETAPAAVPAAGNSPLPQTLVTPTPLETTAPAVPVGKPGNPMDQAVLTAGAGAPTPHDAPVAPAVASQALAQPPAGAAQTFAQPPAANQAVPDDVIPPQQSGGAGQSPTSQTPGATPPSLSVPAGQPSAADSIQVAAHVIQEAPASAGPTAAPGSTPAQGGSQASSTAAPGQMAVGQQQSAGGQSASGDTNQKGQSNNGGLPGAQFRITGQSRTTPAVSGTNDLRTAAANAPAASSAPADSASATAAVASQAAGAAVHTAAPTFTSTQASQPQHAAAAPVVDQVADAVGQSAARGISALTVRLDPPDLGTLHVKLSLAGGELTAQVRADLPDTHQLIAANQHQIRDALQQAGVRLTDLHVQDFGASFNSFGQHQAGQQWDSQPSAQPRTLLPQTPPDAVDPVSSGVYQTDGRALMDSFA